MSLVTQITVVYLLHLQDRCTNIVNKIKSINQILIGTKDILIYTILYIMIFY